jgi:hypothetical protein
MAALSLPPEHYSEAFDDDAAALLCGRGIFRPRRFLSLALFSENGKTRFDSSLAHLLLFSFLFFLLSYTHSYKNRVIERTLKELWPRPYNYSTHCPFHQWLIFMANIHG